MYVLILLENFSWILILVCLKKAEIHFRWKLKKCHLCLGFWFYEKKVAVTTRDIIQKIISMLYWIHVHFFNNCKNFVDYPLE